MGVFFLSTVYKYILPLQYHTATGRLYNLETETLNFKHQY